MRTLHKLLVLSLLALISFAFSTPNMSMSATDPMLSVTQQAVNPTPMVQMDGGVGCSTPSTQREERGDSLLPLNRWGDVSSFHTRLNTGVMGTDNFIESIQKQSVASLFMTAGNMMWKWAAGWTVMADRFCIGDDIFMKIDGMAGIVGNSLVDSEEGRPSVVAIFVVFGLATAIWAASRGQDAKKKIASTLIGVVALSIMVAGSTATANGKPVAGSSFGFASPGWFSSSINNVVRTVASVPAQALNSSIEEFASEPGEIDSLQHCFYYTQALEESYRGSYSSGGGSHHGHTVPAVLKAKAVVPLSLNSMWKTTGLRVFTDAQFGSRNNYGDKVNCRYLEIAAGIPNTYVEALDNDVATKDQLRITGGLGGSEGITADSAPFRLTDDDKVDQAMIAWAACKVDDGSIWSVSADWAGDGKEKPKASSRGQITGDHCTEFFTGNNQFPKVFNLDEGDKRVEDSSEIIQDYVRNLHGTANTTAIGILMLYAIVSIIILVVFGVLSLAVLVSKIGLLMMTLLLMVVVVASIIPGDSSNNRIAQVFKQYVGMAIMAFGASLMIAMVAVITSTLQELGSAMGNDSIISITWSAISPAVAIFLLHYLFTKVFKAPSPFKPSSGMGFAQAAAGGAVGGAVGGGIISRQMNRARYNAEANMADRFRIGRGRGGAARSSGAGGGEGRIGGMGAGGGGGASVGETLKPGAGRQKLREDADQSALPDEQFKTTAGDPLATVQDVQNEGKAEQKAAHEWADGHRAAAKKQKRGEAVQRTTDVTAAGVSAALHGTRNAVQGTRKAWGKASSETAQTKTRRIEGKNPDGSKFHSGTETVKRNALARNGETLARMTGAGIAAGGKAAWSGAKAMPKAAWGGVKAGSKAVWGGVKAMPKTANSARQFAQRHRTAITAAALGAATVATAGIAAPLAAGYLAKKGVDKVRGKQSPMQQQQRSLDLANYRQHIADQTSAEVQRRNDAAVDAAEKKKAQDAAAEETRKAQQAAQDADDAENKAAGQDTLPMDGDSGGGMPNPEPSSPSDPSRGDEGDQDVLPGF